MMNTSSAFAIGTTHRVCQDYARHGKDYVVLSDGCSSSPDSDFGSRLLVAAACSFVHKFPEFDDRFYDSVVATAVATSGVIGLNEFALDATLLAAYLNENTQEFVTTSYGDGVVAARKKDGGWRIYVQSFPDEHPFYLSYSLDPVRYADYLNKGFGNRIRHWWLLDPDWNIVGEGQDPWPGQPRETLRFPLKEFDLVVIISDGIGSLYQFEQTGTSKTRKNVDRLEAIKGLLDFKNFNKLFAVLRLNHFLTNINSDGIFNGDDLSLGAIHAG